jgi:CRP/FNR family transcriptional regulator, anaerobic regulatory protein
MVAMAETSSGVRSQLLTGREQLDARFGNATSRTVRAGETLASPSGLRGSIYRLRTGWAGQCRDLAGGRRAIVDVYLPGDLIGLDGLFRTRPVENVLALTSIEADAFDTDAGPTELFTSECTAIYVVWLLGHRQRRADRLLTAISCLDGRGRIATMVLDFYKRLRGRKLIGARTYNMPLTQQHIAQYLGLTVVHVNRVLRSLRDDRIASLERNCLTILDAERLSLLAREITISDTAGKTGSKPDPVQQESSEKPSFDYIEKPIFVPTS